MKLYFGQTYFGQRRFGRFGDGEGEGEGAGDPPAGDPPASGEKTFTQKDLDAHIAKRLKKERTDKEKLISELNTLKQSSSLTAQERETLASRVEELENSVLSEQEKAVKQRQQVEQKYTTTVKTLEGERDTWRSRFENSTIERALTDAAVEHEAENPAQIRMMLRGLAKLTEVTGEDGKPTGNFTPTVKITGYAEDGKTLQELDLPISEAIAKLRKDGIHANLFKHKGTPGTGTLPTGGTGKSGSSDDMPTPGNFKSQAEFSKAWQKWRDTHNLDGSKRKTSS